MFHMSYSAPKEPVGKIHHKQDKEPKGLGRYKDGLGNIWDIRGIFFLEDENGKLVKYVQACPYDCLHPYYYDTSDWNYYGFIHQTWEPYVLEEIHE